MEAASTQNLNERSLLANTWSNISQGKKELFQPFPVSIGLYLNILADNTIVLVDIEYTPQNAIKKPKMC